MDTTASPPSLAESFFADLNAWCARFDLGEYPAVDDPSAAVNSLFSLGACAGASAIHCDPLRDRVAIRLRIDGRLHEIAAIPKAHQAAVTAAFKRCSALDLAELRLPQDGRVRVRIHDRTLELLLNVLPVAWGERVMARFVPADETGADLAALDLPTRDRDALAAALRRPRGLLVATAPEAATRQELAALLLEVAGGEGRSALATSSHPIACRGPGVQQTYLRPHIGLTQPAALRAFLRADADVVLVDAPASPEAWRCLPDLVGAGHLVLLLLPERDAPAGLRALARNLDDPPWLAEELLGVLAVVALRRACPEAHEPGADCPICRNTGLAGSRLLASLRAPDPWLREALRAGRRDLPGFSGGAGATGELRARAIELAATGELSPEEVDRVLPRDP